ncbi:MAG: D-alanyl-D-alanine carboxypeptidase family protein [Acidaminobacteraceae bacterium]
MIKKFFYLTIILSLLTASFGSSFALSTGEVVAEGAILIDSDTGQILYNKNMHTPLKPASTTKVLTALLILEKFALDEKVVIDNISPFTPGSRIYIIEGEVFTIEQLLNAMLIESANDVAVALAIHHSGSVEAFADAMNAKAKELGALNSNFENPNGLDGDNHLSTAYDLALIGKAALSNEVFRSIIKKTTYQIPPTNKQPETRYMNNSNKFLYGTGSSNKINYNGESIDIKYDIVTGMKTGYTKAAGQCFIASASKDGRNLIAVILKSEGKNLYIDTRTMLDFGFDKFTSIEIAKKDDPLTTFTIEEKEVPAVLKEDINLLMLENYDKTLL